MVIKKKLHEQAVKKGLIEPKKESLYRRELRPLFVSNFQFSSSEDEDEQEEVRRKAKAAMKAKRKEQRKLKHMLKDKLGDIDLVGGDDVASITKDSMASVAGNSNMAAYSTKR